MSELRKDCQEVRGNLKSIFKKVDEKKINLRRANTLIYCASNIIRTIVCEMEVNKTID